MSYVLCLTLCSSPFTRSLPTLFSPASLLDLSHHPPIAPSAACAALRDNSRDTQDSPTQKKTTLQPFTLPRSFALPLPLYLAVSYDSLQTRLSCPSDIQIDSINCSLWPGIYRSKRSSAFFFLFSFIIFISTRRSFFLFFFSFVLSISSGLDPPTVPISPCWSLAKLTITETGTTLAPTYRPALHFAYCLQSALQRELLCAYVHMRGETLSVARPPLHPPFLGSGPPPLYTTPRIS